MSEKMNENLDSETPPSDVSQAESGGRTMSRAHYLTMLDDMRNRHRLLTVAINALQAALDSGAITDPPPSKEGATE